MWASTQRFLSDTRPTALVARMTVRGFQFRNPVRDLPQFRYVMIAGPDDLLIELFECRDPARWGIER